MSLDGRALYNLQWLTWTLCDLCQWFTPCWDPTSVYLTVIWETHQNSQFSVAISDLTCSNVRPNIATSLANIATSFIPTKDVAMLAKDVAMLGQFVINM